MSAPRIALASVAAARALDEDLAPLLRALREIGCDAMVADWDDRTFDWSAVDLAVLRSTWDYADRPAAFLAWAEAAARQTRLLNPPPVLHWNTDKHYLADLSRAGVATVPSRFVEPDDDAEAALDAFLHEQPDADIVVKPCIGAGSRDAQRHARERRDSARTHLQRLLHEGRSVLLQPYLDRVDEHGETALVYFDGIFSHAIRKGPLLRRGEGPTSDLFAVEDIRPRQATAEECSLAERALAAIPFAMPLAYARGDVIRDGADQPVLLELELAEPSLFLAHGRGSAEHFASVLHRYASTGSA